MVWISDVNQDFWQVSKVEIFKDGSTFFSVADTYGTNQMFFGLISALKTFQLPLFIIIDRFERRYYLAYLEDKLSFLKSFNQQFQDTENMTSTLNAAGE